MDEEIWIKDKEIKILDALACYKYLVPYQFFKLGIAGHMKTIERYLKRMREENPRNRLINFKKWGWEQGVGNRHTCYTLSERGAEVLADYYECDVSRIEYPKGKMIFERDYFHRLHTVDTMIAIRLWAARAGAHIEKFHTYLNSTGAQRSSAGKFQNKTRTIVGDGFFVPDGICFFEHEGKRRLIALEIHNRNKTHRIFQQLQKHMEALVDSSLSKAYGHDKANFVLSVFEEVGTMRATIKALRQTEHYENFLSLLHFATIEDVKNNIETAWIDGNGQAVGTLFYGSAASNPSSSE